MRLQDAHMLIGVVVILLLLFITFIELPGLLLLLLLVLPIILLRNKYKWSHPKPAPKPAFKIFTQWDFYGLDKPFKHLLIGLATLFLLFSLLVSYQVIGALLSPQETNGHIMERDCHNDEKCNYPTYLIEYKVNEDVFSIISSTRGIRIKSPSPLRSEGKKEGDKVTVIYNFHDPKIGIVDKEIASGLRFSVLVNGIAITLLLSAIFLPIKSRGNLVRMSKPDTI